MSIIEQLRDELKNMTNEEKEELSKLLKPEEKELPGRYDVLYAPSRRGYYGEELTDEQYYDYTHRIDDWWTTKQQIIELDYYGKRKVSHRTKEEVVKHNEELFKDYVPKKMEYAKKRGLSFSPVYNPPKPYNLIPRHLAENESFKKYIPDSLKRFNTFE